MSAGEGFAGDDEEEDVIYELLESEPEAARRAPLTLSESPKRLLRTGRLAAAFLITAVVAGYTTHQVDSAQTTTKLQDAVAASVDFSQSDTPESDAGTTTAVHVTVHNDGSVPITPLGIGGAFGSTSHDPGTKWLPLTPGVIQAGGWQGYDIHVPIMCGGPVTASQFGTGIQLRVRTAAGHVKVLRFPIDQTSIDQVTSVACAAPMVQVNVTYAGRQPLGGLPVPRIVGRSMTIPVEFQFQVIGSLQTPQVTALTSSNPMFTVSTSLPLPITVASGESVAGDLTLTVVDCGLTTVESLGEFLYAQSPGSFQWPPYGALADAGVTAEIVNGLNRICGFH